MLKLLAKLFGTKSDKDIKRMMPLVEQTRKEGETLQGISNDELRNETKKIQQVIEQELKSIDDKIAGLHHQVASQPHLDLNEKEAVFAEIDKLEKDRNKQLEVVLMKVLPRTFAIVRETARRFKENQFVEVTARDYDIEFAARHPNIRIEGGKAIWANQW